MINEWDLAENVTHSHACMELMTCCITGFDTFSATWIVVTLKFGLRFQFINFSSLIKSSSKTAAANKLIAFSQTISFTTSLFLKCDRPLKKSVLSHTVFWEPLVEELRLYYMEIRKRGDQQAVQRGGMWWGIAIPWGILWQTGLWCLLWPPWTLSSYRQWPIVCYFRLVRWEFFLF